MFAGCADLRAARIAREGRVREPGERTPTAAEFGLGSGTTLGIEQGLGLALRHNPAVAASRARVSAAAARAGIRRSVLWPQISASADVQWSQKGTIDPSTHTDVEKKVSGGLSLRMLLLDFGQARADIRAALEELLASDQDLASSENDTAFNFRQAFFNVLKQEELVRVAEETVRQFEVRLKQTEGFVQVGARVRYDLTKAQVDLGNARLNFVRVRTALTVARAVLQGTLGLAEDPRYKVARPEFRDEPSPSFEEAFARARRDHPALLALDFRERAAEAALDAAVADLFPSISLKGSLSASKTMSPVASPWGWSWAAGPVLDAVLFSGGAKTFAIRESIASLRVARVNRARTEQEIALEVRRACASLEDARERQKIAALTVKQAEENLELVQASYKVGKSSSVDLTDAQVSLSNARGEEVQARFDFQIAQASLKKAMGIREGGAKKPEEKKAEDQKPEEKKGEGEKGGGP
ncbi:MAG: TolC family protein [Planctomycetota bacterium]